MKSLLVWGCLNHISTKIDFICDREQKPVIYQNKSDNLLTTRLNIVDGR